MTTFSFLDGFLGYPAGPFAGGAYRVLGNPVITNAGRGGKPVLAMSQDGLIFSAGGNSSHFVLILKVDDGGSVISPLCNVRDYLPGVLTSSNWLVGGSMNGWPYSGLVVTADGSIHVHRGGAFAANANSLHSEIAASSAPGVVPIQRGWFLLEVIFVWHPIFGSASVRINNQLVLSYTGGTVYPEPYCNVFPSPDCDNVAWPSFITEGVIGRGTRGAFQFHGWFGLIDFLGVRTPADTNDFLGEDLTVELLTPIADGAVSESTIVGTEIGVTTRWESVADGNDIDNDATAVRFTDTAAPAEDEYVMSPISGTPGDIYGVQVTSVHRVSSPGYSISRLGASDGTNLIKSAALFSRARDYLPQSAVLPTAPDGSAWSEAALTALRVRVEREV